MPDLIVLKLKLHIAMCITVYSIRAVDFTCYRIK